MSNDAHDHNHRRTEKSSPGEDETSSASLRNDSPPDRDPAPDTSAPTSEPQHGVPRRPEGAPDMEWPQETPTARLSDAQEAKRPDNPFAPKANRDPEHPRTARRGPGTAPAAKPSRRKIAALAIAGVAVLCVIAVVVSYALWALNREPDADAAGSPAPELSASPGPVLGGPQMLSEALAKEIDATRSWQQVLDEDGVSDSSPQIACVGPQAASQPNPSITQLRGLSASGDDRTAALHRADAYDTAEEAQKVFDFRSAELGACTDTSLYIEKGMNITGLGDEALGVRLALQDTTPEYHSVVLVRTGRVVNLLDVARMGEAVDMESSVKALGGAINRQCGPAIGLCTAPETSVTAGIPPPGGEQPGLLTSGDIPRVTPGQGNWRGNPPAKRVDIQDGSSCEAVDFATVGGSQVDRTQRTYLLRNDAAAPPAFGIDQVVLTMGSPAEATELADRVAKNIAECGTRTLTSEVVAQGERSTPGVDGVEVKARWFVVNQKVDANQTQRYRVGIVSAGDKTVYLRANPSETFDFSDEGWTSVNLRAGERATQIT